MNNINKYFPFDPETKKPNSTLPRGSCDSQFHVFGDRSKYPVRPEAAYEMPTATIDEALKMHKVLGIERGIIVQPTTYGLDHSAMLDGLSVAGEGYKGCAISSVLLELSDTEIDKLDKAGVRGIRFNFMKMLNLHSDEDMFKRAVARAREIGWYVKIQPGKNGIGESVSLIKDIKDVQVVIDHLGRPDISKGVNNDSSTKLINLLKQGNFWVMLSNGHKISKYDKPWSDVIPIAASYIKTAPDRVIWGTDWPHPISVKQPPNDGALVDLLYSFSSDPHIIEKILVDNPANLFGF